MNTYIGVDVGGTQIRVAIFPETGSVPIHQERISTRNTNESELDRLVSLISQLWPTEGKVLAIGVAAPGPLDSKAGVIFSAPNIPAWVDLPLRQVLKDRFCVPVALGNDANLAALGEWKYGAGQGHHNLLYMTISTGIGGGVISDDHLLLGEHGLATELGHVTILPDGPLCSCGQRGHVEAICSGTGIANYVAEEIQKGIPTRLPAKPRPTSKEIAQAARDGDALALAAMDRAAGFLGLALANYLHIFNPSIIILGGGVSRSGDVLFTPMKAAMHKYIIDPAYFKDLTITTAALGDNAGLLGALALAQEIQS
jgi:glucokinase